MLSALAAIIVLSASGKCSDNVMSSHFSLPVCYHPHDYSQFLNSQCMGLYTRAWARGGGAWELKPPPNFWVKENKGRKKHPTNKKGYPSQTHPH